MNTTCLYALLGTLALCTSASARSDHNWADAGIFSHSNQDGPAGRSMAPGDDLLDDSASGRAGGFPDLGVPVLTLPRVGGIDLALAFDPHAVDPHVDDPTPVTAARLKKRLAPGAVAPELRNPASPVPAPATLALAGLFALGQVGRRRRH